VTCHLTSTHHGWLSLALSGAFDAKTATKTWGKLVNFDPGGLNFGLIEYDIEWAYVLNAIYVPPSQRRKGLVNKLIEYAKRLVARTHGENKIMLVLIDNFETVAAMRCYEKSGFKLGHDYRFQDFEFTNGRAAIMRLDVTMNDFSN
jgi:GNAT superfamily N-acetyltransferase